MTYVEPITYATPLPRSGARVWAGAVIVLAGLGMIVIGGCFLIGVMLTVSGGFAASGTTILTTQQHFLVVVLYGLAFGSFGGAIWLLYVGIRGLIRTLSM